MDSLYPVDAACWPLATEDWWASPRRSMNVLSRGSLLLFGTTIVEVVSIDGFFVCLISTIDEVPPRNTNRKHHNWRICNPRLRKDRNSLPI